MAANAGVNPPNPGTAAITLTPVFKLVFLSVLFVTVLCLAISVYLSLHGSAATQSLNEKLLTIFNSGFGAIIGLIGGKTT